MNEQQEVEPRLQPLPPTPSPPSNPTTSASSYSPFHNNEELLLTGASELTFYDEFEDTLTDDCSSGIIDNKRRNCDRTTKSHNREKQKRQLETLKSIQTQVLVPLSQAIKKFKEQRFSLNEDSSIKRHILHYYKNVLELTKTNNRWYCSKEKLNSVDFNIDMHTYSKRGRREQQTI